VRQFHRNGRFLAITSTAEDAEDAEDAETDEIFFASCVNRSLCGGFLLCALCDEKQALA
jgi:hypothetical protein